MRSSARVDQRLIAALDRLDDRDRPMAETYRRLGAVADELGLTRPSYERVRYLIHLLRSRRMDPGVGEVLLDVVLRNRPPESVIDALIDRRQSL